MTGFYEPFDQGRHLPPPPWSPDDPTLIAWEAAHGHDVRLKCYPEFGCQVIEAEADELRARVEAVLALCDRGMSRWTQVVGDRQVVYVPVEDVRALLDPTPEARRG